jgi:L-alanine-DL-glutamate epimerase-like enolase superfamily enzyme
LLALEWYSIGYEPPWIDTVMSPPITSLLKDGFLQLLTGPGWGVEMNELEMAQHPYVETWYSKVVGVGMAGQKVE